MLMKKKNNLLNDEQKEQRRVEELLEKEREYAAMILKDLMSMEGFLKQQGEF
jgi:hypothetical protein